MLGINFDNGDNKDCKTQPYGNLLVVYYQSLIMLGVGAHEIANHSKIHFRLHLQAKESMISILGVSFYPLFAWNTGYCLVYVDGTVNAYCKSQKKWARLCEGEFQADLFSPSINE